MLKYALKYALKMFLFFFKNAKILQICALKNNTYLLKKTKTHKNIRYD